MINSDRGINPVAMTVMSGFNIGEAGGSNQRPPVVKSCTLPTELRGSTKKNRPKIHCHRSNGAITNCNNIVSIRLGKI